MGRPVNVARSRACQQCKRKRIKCDLGSPCQRCIESNLDCSGPVTGLFIINSAPVSTAESRRSKVSGSGSIQSSWSIGDHGMNNIQFTYAPLNTTPTLAPNVYDEVLLWNFLTYFSQNAGGRVWTARLPELVVAKNKVALRTAARAVSLAFAAENLNLDRQAAAAGTARDMGRAARECYGTSLRYHQFSFVTPVGKGEICRKKAVNALPVTVLLSYFEMIQATSRDAWLRHTLAAERLFVLLGPESLEEPLLNHLYFIVRANSVIRAVIEGQNTRLVGGRWSEVKILSPCGRGTVALHDLVGLISRIWWKLGLEEGAGCFEAINELNVLWVDFADQIGWTDGVRSLVSESYLFYGPERVPDYLLDGGIALTESFFHAAAMLSITLGNRGEEYSLHGHSFIQNDYHGPTSIHSSSDQADRLQQHASRILELSRYQKSRRVGCACLRMVLPLTIVSRFSTDVEQCLEAVQLFRHWCMEDGLPGLAAFSFGMNRGYLNPG